MDYITKPFERAELIMRVRDQNLYLLSRKLSIVEKSLRLDDGSIDIQSEVNRSLARDLDRTPELIEPLPRPAGALRSPPAQGA